MKKTFLILFVLVISKLVLCNEGIVGPKVYCSIFDQNHVDPVISFVLKYGNFSSFSTKNGNGKKRYIPGTNIYLFGYYNLNGANLLRVVLTDKEKIDVFDTEISPYLVEQKLRFTFEGKMKFFLDCRSEKVLASKI